MSEKAWVEKAEMLADILNDSIDTTEVDFTQFYAANYDDPMKLWNRRNEVMFVVKKVWKKYKFIMLYKIIL